MFKHQIQIQAKAQIFIDPVPCLYIGSAPVTISSLNMTAHKIQIPAPKHIKFTKALTVGKKGSGIKWMMCGRPPNCFLSFWVAGDALIKLNFCLWFV